MDIEIRVPTAEDMNGIFDVRAQAFAVGESDRERWTKLIDPAGMLAAFLGTTVVGALNIIDFGQYFGGRSVPMGGLATVVVRPEHRGQGVGARLLESSCVAMRDRGLVVSTLNPATTRVYRAAGWEIGGDLASHRIPTRALERIPRGETEGLRRLAAEDWPRVIACYDAVAPEHTGWLDRTQWWWDLYEEDTREDQYFVYGIEGTDGDLLGYVSFEQKAAGEMGMGYEIHVEELTAREPSAAVALWHFLGTHAMQVPYVKLNRGGVEPLLLVLPEQDVEQTSNNRWMHRLVDAPAAIAARGYPPNVAAEVHLDLTDRLAPWNSGQWVLKVEGGHGELAAGGTGAIQLTINAFSALSTGWASARLLAEAGALHHGSPADHAALDAIFAGPHPTMLDDF